MGVRIILVVAALFLDLILDLTLRKRRRTRDINVILPLTGGGAFLGKAEQQALTQFEKAVNSSGGIHGQPVKFVFHDDQRSPQVAVQLANQVKATNPPVILGSALVALCNAMAPLMKEGPLLYCFSPGIIRRTWQLRLQFEHLDQGTGRGATAVFRPQGLEEGRADHLDRRLRAGRLPEFQVAGGKRRPQGCGTGCRSAVESDRCQRFRADPAVEGRRSRCAGGVVDRRAHRHHLQGDARRGLSRCRSQPPTAI